MGAKAAAGAGSMSLAGAISTLLLALFWPDASANISVALTTVIAAPITYFVTFYTPHA